MSIIVQLSGSDFELLGKVADNLTNNWNSRVVVAGWIDQAIQHPIGKVQCIIPSVDPKISILLEHEPFCLQVGLPLDLQDFIIQYEPDRQYWNYRTLTHTRQYCAGISDCLLVIGGRESGSMGRIPGVLEEVFQTLRVNKPVYIAPQFGGMGKLILDRKVELEPESFMMESWYKDVGVEWFSNREILGTIEQKRHLINPSIPNRFLETDDLGNFIFTVMNHQ